MNFSKIIKLKYACSDKTGELFIHVDILKSGDFLNNLVELNGDDNEIEIKFDFEENSLINSINYLYKNFTEVKTNSTEKLKSVMMLTNCDIPNVTRKYIREKNLFNLDDLLFFKNIDVMQTFKIIKNGYQNNVKEIKDEFENNLNDYLKHVKTIAPEFSEQFRTRC